MQNDPWLQPHSLPLQRRFEGETRPQSVHASPPAFPTFHTTFEQAPAPRGSLAGLGVLPEAAERRLSREDTAANVSELISPAPYAVEAIRSEEQTAAEGQAAMWPDTMRLDNIRSQRSQRRSVFKISSSNTATESSVFQVQTASLGRRFSRTITDIKDNMSVSRYRTTGKVRRASTPQGIDVSGHVHKFSSGVPVPPTSPSKRNGKHESDRPLKQHRHLLSLGASVGDRKDTPAPSALAMARPAFRSTNSSFAMSMNGGDRARQAAAAAKLSPIFHESVWAGQDDDIFSRRSRVGSMSSAADSGADLSSYAGSNPSFKDLDGDIDMFNSPPEPLKRDPLTTLPHEISLQVLEWLDASDVLTCERICRDWRNLALKTSVWRAAFERKYQRQVYSNPAPIQVGGAGCGRPNRPNQQWKRMYKARTLLDKNWKVGPAGAGKAVYLSGHTDSVYCVQFDEEKIITGSRDRTIRVWDINNFTCQRVIGGPNVKPNVGPKVLRTVDYPDFHLATASVNGTTYGNTIYQVPSQWHDASILCLQYDEQILVTGSSDSDLIVWDIKTYEPIKRLCRHEGGVLDVALDAKHIVSCSKDSRIIVWSRETYQPIGELTGHRGPVNAVQMRGDLLVSASGDGIARLWDLKQMKLIKAFPEKARGLAAVEFSEDMKYVLAGGNDTITYKFEVETGEEVKQYTGHTQLVRSLWLDSQNSRVVSGSYDLDLRVYDFNTGAEIWRAEEWTTSWMLAAKSDYRRIVATSQDGRILIIDFGLKKLRTPDDGQPIDGVDLLRGTDNSNAIEWRDPWEMMREKDRARQRAVMQAYINANPLNNGQSS